MKTAIKRVGNSQGLLIPKPILEQMGIVTNDEVEMRLEGRTLLVNKAKKRAYTAKELNAQCDPKAPMPEDLIAWDNAPCVGSEAL